MMASLPTARAVARKLSLSQPSSWTKTKNLNINVSNFSTTATAGSTKARVAARKVVAPEQRAILRQARKEQQDVSSAAASSSAAAGGSASGRSSTSSKPTDPRIVFGLSIGVPSLLLTWTILDPHSPPAKLLDTLGFTQAWNSLTSSYQKPSRAKLLPDWGSMPNVPNMPPPHTLVLDLENTLIHSTWDRKYGWRYVKRPGLDQFLADMASYYEIVLYSPSPESIAVEIVANLDKKGCIMHHLFRDCCDYHDGVYRKDLNSMNRNLNKIILIDDDEQAGQLNPGNLLKVKPFDPTTDGGKEDDTLRRITPFLIEIAKEGYDDIPQLLSQFGNMDADEIATELERRVDSIKQERKRVTQRGLGGFLGAAAGGGGMDLPPPEMTPVPEQQRRSAAAGGVGTGSAPTAKDLVGAAPPSASGTSSSSGGGMSGWLQRRQMEQEEQQVRKMEKWNEVMMKKSAEKQRRMEQGS